MNRVFEGERIIKLREGLPDMVQGKFVEWESTELPPRIPYEELEGFLKSDFECYEEDFYGWDISKLTPMELAVPAFNFLECILDTRVKMPTGDYWKFELIEDYGVRMISYGNASGGKF